MRDQIEERFGGESSAEEDEESNLEEGEEEEAPPDSSLDPKLTKPFQSEDLDMELQDPPGGPT